ncbi:MAG: hypothetical protein H6932_15915 [Burkholderiaceae bacterium]|nr:hypothetical protein [Rhodoferax sp.]MCP5272685.1 hypothetical protein [Burkholderiaceae bacterium]
MERSTTYLLKVWQAAGGGFRAHLRAVDQETALAFDDTQALAAHLAAAAQPGPAPPRSSAITGPPGATTGERCSR